MPKQMMYNPTVHQKIENREINCEIGILSEKMKRSRIKVAHEKKDMKAKIKKIVEVC